jgi:hypothetical protein
MLGMSNFFFSVAGQPGRGAYVMTASGRALAEHKGERTWPSNW